MAGETTVTETQREAEVTSKPNFELLSEYMSEETTNPPIEEKPKEEVKEEKPVEEQEVTLPTEEKPVEEKPTEEVKVDEKPTEESLEVPLELKLDDTTEEISNDEPETWVALAKLKGYDIKEDTLEAYEEAVITPIKALRKEELLAELAPEHRMYMELAEAGLTHEEIVAPLKNIEKYKLMSDTELYREDLMIRYPEATTEWIDADVEKAVENGQAVHEATRIRLELGNAEKNIVQERQEIIEKYKVNKDSYLANKRNEEVQSVTKAMNDMSSFMGKTIPEDIRKQMSVNYSNGMYDQLLSDPQAKAEFIAYKKLGSQLLKNIEAESYNKGKYEVTKKLHNTPTVTTGGAGKSITNTTEGNFEKLEGDSHLKG